MIARRHALHLAALFVIVFFIAPSVILAQSNLLPSQIVPQDCNNVGGCQSICDLATLAQNVLNAGIYIAVFLAAFLFAWAGWKYLTAAGGGEVTKAKQIFTDVAIGLVIILAGWLVVDTLIKTLTGGKFGPWNKICELLVHQALHVSGLA